MNEIFESKDFYKPIVTPFDVELALNPLAINAGFSYDFNTYLPRDDLTNESLEELKEQITHDVSLVSGKMRGPTMDLENNEDAVNTKQLVSKSKGTVALSSNFGAGFLSDRSWKGLEQNLGEDAPELMTEGRRGIAQAYENEK